MSYSPLQSLNAFAVGSQIGSGMRNAKTRNVFSEHLANDDLAGAEKYALSRGNLELADYAGAKMANEQQATALQTQQTQLADAEAKAQKLTQLKALTENMLTMPEAQRGQFLMQNWSQIEPIVESDFMTFWQASGGDVSDQSLNEDLAMFRTQLGEGPPAGPEYGFMNVDGVLHRTNKQDGSAEALTEKAPPELPWWAGPDGNIHPAMLAYREAGRSSTTVNNNLPANKGESEFQKQRGASASNRMDGITEAGDAAASTLADAEMMNTLIDQIDYTGFGSETLLNVQKLGRMVGLDIGDDVPAKEAATRLTAKLGLALKSDLPGPMSDGDRDFLLSIPPNIGTTREGNKALVFMMMKRAQFAQEMQRSLIEADPKTMQEFYEWERQFRTTYPPLFDEASKQDLLAALGASGT